LDGDCSGKTERQSGTAGQNTWGMHMGHVAQYRPWPDVKDGEVLGVINLPTELRSIFDQTPLLSHEDPKAYWVLLSRFAQEIRPSDTIEWLWLKDIADQSWEIIGLRHIKAALLDAGRGEGPWRKF
jgi:hypothetical protein